MAAFGKEVSAVLATLCAYQLRVLPLVHRRLRRWEEVARTIPDPDLRRQALAAVTEKASNVEAVAVFATLAPPAARPAVIGAIVALQVAIDFLDTLGEQPSTDPLRDGLALHQALGAAVTPGEPAADWFAFHPQGEDGGYLDRLVAACQESLRALPASSQVLAVARRAAVRCGEAQSHTHAAAIEGGASLESWTKGRSEEPVFRWWELAAAASSSVAAHALIAAAAGPRFIAAEAEALDAAYFPAVGALTVLLDDLVDRDEDRASGNHSYMDYYEDGAEVADRLGLIMDLARASTNGLRQSRRHAAILTGVAAFYLSQPGAAAPFASPVRARLLRSAGPATRPLAALLKLRPDL